MIRTILFSNYSPTKENLAITEINKVLKDPECLLWVSIENGSEEEIKTVLKEIFNFHPLTIEDCLNSGYQTPKLDDFDEYLFIIANTIRNGSSWEEIETSELNIYLGKNYIITCYTDPIMSPVTETWKLLSRDNRLHKNGSDFLCHSILDRLVDEYMPFLDHMDEEIDWLEEKVLSKPEPQTLEKILVLKHNIMSLRRIISPLREIMNRLSRDEFSLIDRQSQIYFRDIYDHLVRIQDLGESLRDIITGALDIYLNSTSLRLNEIMKALTIVSTIFLPLSFIAGIYGMNFQYMPELSWSFGYYFTWTIFVILAITMLLIFKRRGWF